jgi:hypothetical protein
MFSWKYKNKNIFKKIEWVTIFSKLKLYGDMLLISNYDKLNVIIVDCKKSLSQRFKFWVSLHIH